MHMVGRRGRTGLAGKQASRSQGRVAMPVVRWCLGLVYGLLYEALWRRWGGLYWKPVVPLPIYERLNEAGTEWRNREKWLLKASRPSVGQD